MQHPEPSTIPQSLYQQLQGNDCLATISLAKSKLLAKPKLYRSIPDQNRYVIRAYLPSHSERIRVENYIANVFKQNFKADLKEFLPLLIAIEKEDGEIFAALGVRFADKQALFAEQYTHKEIDYVVLELFDILDKREHIVEIGSLASSQTGYARHLFLAMTKILTSWRYQWLTFTAIPVVVNVFKKLKLNPIELCSATLKDLVNTETNWGSYYDKNPKVMIGDVFAANEYLEQHNCYRNIEFRQAIVGRQ